MTTRKWIALGMVAVLIAALAGCNDNEIGPDKRKPNQPPQTILSSGPPDSTYGTNYKVHLFWSGSDPDGTIDHYDYIMVDHPAANDSIAAGDPNYENQVVVVIPEADDPHWTSTSASDTLIVTKADTLRVNPAPPPGSSDSQVRRHNDFVRLQSFQRWHTFFVRAVDNEGSVDLTPEYRSFNAQTLAPNVALRPPVDPKLSQFSGPRTIVFSWDGSDDTGEGIFIDPIAARWTILQTRKDQQQQYVGYPDTLYRLPPSAWKPWQRWDARDRSGRQAIVRNLLPAGSGPNNGFYLFAVQAMDEAGAVTPIFDAHTIGKNNVAKVFVNDQVGATLVVEERFLGASSFVAGSRPVRLDVAAGQPISFKWRGDASGYGGEIVAYRYGWNISDPSNDQLWEQGWCGTCRSAPVRAFNSGTQRFFLECRDNAETITRAEFELVVRQVTRRLDLLFVDDSRHPQGASDPAESQEDQRWRRTIDSLQVRADARGQHFDFDYSRDWYDVINDRQNFPPPLPTVFDYKTVVWTVVNNGGSAINTLADFFDPFVQRNQNAVVAFNYLSVYVDNGGEFWLMGDTPATAIFTSMNSGPAEILKIPVNITNWDDRLQPHPERDSVGTRSFLWRLGVEAVDLGSGSRATQSRQNPNQGCLRFARATPQGYESQSFESTLEVDHTHTLLVQTSDIDQPPAGGVTYTTAMALEHTHQVTLTQVQLKTLAAGNTVTVQTTVSPLPEPHSHEYTLVDQVGLWGAPASLETDAGLWPLPPGANDNPYRSRANVEVYNMPVYMAQQSPPLDPELGISVVLYNFVSATPYDANINPPGYPRTADGQPVIILRKASILEPYYSRCIAGFEPWRLQQSSMLALADYVLLRHFRLGILDEP